MQMSENQLSECMTVQQGFVYLQSPVRLLLIDYFSEDLCCGSSLEVCI